MPETCEKSVPEAISERVRKARECLAYPHGHKNMITGGEDRGTLILGAGYRYDETGELVLGPNPIFGSFVKVLADPAYRSKELVVGGVVITRNVGVAAMVEFLNKPAQVDDAELAGLVEEELRGLLKKFPDEVPQRKGSPARPASSVKAKGGHPLPAHRATRYFSKICG